MISVELIQATIEMFIYIRVYLFVAYKWKG